MKLPSAEDIIEVEAVLPQFEFVIGNASLQSSICNLLPMGLPWAKQDQITIRRGFEMTFRIRYTGVSSVVLAIGFAVFAVTNFATVSAQEGQASSDGQVILDTDQDQEADAGSIKPGKSKAKKKLTRGKITYEVNKGYEQVELFQAIENGDITVRLIPKDSTVCTVIVENNSDKPLSVQMPEVFAGVPVLAQAGNIGGG
ncbi:MAG TPA: hypothetical protein PKA83_18125, partial [Pirellulaceae bacterium]|nr:hypothetical protein [Pirellulaceae bacterium]